MAEIEAVCGGNERVHSFPTVAVPALKSDDRLAKEMALENQGCGYCLARTICKPRVSLLKVAEEETKVNAGATVTPGVERLKQAGVI